MTGGFTVWAFGIIAAVTLCPLPVAMLLDWILGDPRWLPHPVRLLGYAISWLERALRRIFPATPKGELAAGTALALVVPLGAAAAAAAVLWLAARAGIGWYFALDTFVCYQLLAVRNLRDESRNVQRALADPDISAAREAVGRIVGRDAVSLDREGIICAAVETVSENTNDAVIAPMLFMALGGAAAGMFYKAVNTLDSMVGYKNERYLYFGRVSARLDDLCGLVPARLAALLTVAAAWLLRYDASSAWRIFLRDRGKHNSPNSAQTESACAGALGLRLGGGASYGGVFAQKPFIGDDTCAPAPEDISRANRLMITASVLFAAILLLAKILFLLLNLYNGGVL